MDVYNEETLGKRKGKHILMLDSKEARILIDMVEFACKGNKKKRTWKKIFEGLEGKLDCYYAR
jgi:spermidine/putrescine-binding protein